MSIERIGLVALDKPDLFVDQQHFKAETALSMIDGLITGVYLPFRGQQGYGTERATLAEASHMPHRENDAEHSWHVAQTALVLYQNRERLGLYLPKGFNLEKMLTYAIIHDVPEIRAPDVDAMSTDAKLIKNKSAKERAGALMLCLEMPFMADSIEEWEDYEEKANYEACFVSDVDKIAGTRIICADGGKRWHKWGDSGTSMERMVRTVRAKLLTAFGHQIMDVIEQDLARNPQYFPQFEYPQGKLF